MGRGRIKSRTTEIRKRAGQAAGWAGFCINQPSFRSGAEPLPSQSKRENGEVPLKIKFRCILRQAKFLSVVKFKLFLTKGFIKGAMSDITNKILNNSSIPEWPISRGVSYRIQ